MRIGEVARLTGHTTDAVRYYEKEGLLPPGTRAENNYREYGERHVERLNFIRRCRSLSLGLDEIRNLLEGIEQMKKDRARDAHLMIDMHLMRVRSQIRELRELERSLEALNACCEGRHESPEDCSLLKELVDGHPAR